jgi:hypothetical protein
MFLGSVHFKGFAKQEKPVKHGKTRNFMNVDSTRLSKFGARRPSKKNGSAAAAVPELAR